MALFLNTIGLSECITELIRDARREIVIIVPYIKTSENLYRELVEANKRGVETTIIYRENKLTETEKSKFHSIDNLNLLHHPNVHAKCYYNGSKLIIASMNMYEYSELNNREMGVLLTLMDDGILIFEDAIKEINAIKNGSQLEKESRETKYEGFNIDILKSQRERTEDRCKFLSRLFIHKKFEVSEISGLDRMFYQPICKDYFDKIDVIINERVEIMLKFHESKIKRIYANMPTNKNALEYYFSGYKVYWNSYYQPIYIYRDRNLPIWRYQNEEGDIKILKEGIDKVIEYLRNFF